MNRRDWVRCREGMFVRSWLQDSACMTPIELYPVCASALLGQYELVNLLSSESDEEAEVKRRPLHEAVIAFTARCQPSLQETAAVESIRRVIDDSARAVLPSAYVSLFGSRASGLALPSSDIDLVVLGTPFDVFAPLRSFSKREKGDIVELLGKLRRELFESCKGSGKIINATIPILRLEIPWEGRVYHVDVSVGVLNSIDAVTLFQIYLRANPAILPLFVVLKALLKERQLNEVYRGGMSSYSLFTTVVAHLMMENYYQPPIQAQNHTEAVQYDWTEISEMPLDTLLVSYLKRFGNWDASLAVSIMTQGTIPVEDLEDVKETRALRIEDPQAPGKDASRGSFQMRRVVKVFKGAAVKLEEALEEADCASSPFPVLDAVLDCEACLKPSEKSRRKKRNPPPRSSPSRKRRRPRDTSKQHSR